MQRKNEKIKICAPHLTQTVDQNLTPHEYTRIKVPIPHFEWHQKQQSTAEPQRTQFEVEMPVPLLIYACICQIREKTGPKRLFSSLLFSYQSGNMERKCIDCAVSHLPQESVSCWYALCMSYCGGVVGGSDTARGWHPPVAGSVSVGLSFALHMPRPGLTRSLVPLLLYAVLCGVLPAFPSRCGRSDPCVLVQHTKHTLQCIRRAYSNIFRY